MRLKQLLIILGATVALIILMGIFFKYFNFSEPIPQFQPKDAVSAAVVPHHDLAKTERAALFQELASLTHPKTIILISPNHFDSGKSNFVVTDKTWKISNAVINPATRAISDLTKNEMATLDTAAFDREHGITNVLDDLARYFPDADLLPVMIKQNTPESQVESFATNLQSACTSDCLLIASVDFSHYQPGALAEIHDDLSIRALENLDENEIYKTEVDSPQALALSILWAKSQNTEKFVLKKETNSGEIAGDPDAESTSYVLGWFTEGKKVSSDGITFQIGGDMMFDRLISYRYPKSKLVDVVQNLGNRFFDGTDISIVNLEGPVAESYSAPNTAVNNLKFRFPPQTIDVLKWLNLDAVSLANNHTLNGGVSMLANTKAVLQKAGIAPIGDETHVGEQNFSSQNQLTIFTINTLEDGTNLAERIAAAKTAGNFVLIFPHWGSEYSKIHSATQERLAHAWIDAGADLVIGSHPHVVQDAELYNGKPIFYSLGNLLFDQTFSSETQRGLVIAGKITTDKLTLVLLPTVQKNLQPQLLKGQERADIINKFRVNLNLASASGYGYDIIELNR